MADKYANYEALAAVEKIGVDYEINTQKRKGAKSIIFAPHGGSIEAGTSELVKEVAKGYHNWYEFAGIKSTGNTDLHITSTNFDEPQALQMLGEATHAMSLHGYSDSVNAHTEVGGLDSEMVEIVIRELQKEGFSASVATGGIAGLEPENITNRTSRGMGVQLELSTLQRRNFFTNDDFSSSNRGNTTDTFKRYVRALRRAMNKSTATFPFSHVKGGEQTDNISSEVSNLSKKSDGIINLAEFGANGNGTFDNYQAFSDAFAKWKEVGGVIRIPKGVFYTSDFPPLEDGVKIEGSGSSKSVIKVPNTITAFKSPSISKFVSLKGFQLVTNETNPTNIALDLTSVGNSLFEDIRIYGFKTGIKLSNSVNGVCYYNTFVSCRVETCKQGVTFDTYANGHNFIGSRFVQCEEGIILDTKSSGNTFTSCGIEIHTALANPAYGVKFGAEATANTFVGCRIELQGSGEVLFCTSATADYNTVVGGDLFVATPLSGGGSFKGFTGTGGTNNTVLNAHAGTSLKSVSTIESADTTASPLFLRGKTKTPNGQAFRFYTYKADLATLQEVLQMTGGTDAPVVKVPYDATLQSEGQIKYSRDIEGTGNGNGLIFKSPDGLTKKKLTIDNAGNPVWTTI
jgi:phage replication-related protein YjqB (UPF0714/DUF867 family)